MISTITLNPSVDKRYILDDFEKGKVSRALEVHNTAGGKGINVARVVKQLGEKVGATGFLGGANGDFISKELEKLNIKSDFVKISEDTRCCIAILSNSCGQTEILEPGPQVTEDELDSLYIKYSKMLQDSSIVCASGSILKEVPASIYKELITKAKNYDVKFILDTSGDALVKGIEARPHIIKPNKDELEYIFNKKLESEAEIIRCAKKLGQTGIEIVFVSLGERGSIVVKDDRAYKVEIPNIEAVNPVGSGDSTVAGLAVALQRGYDFRDMLAFATSCGTANAMERETGMIRIENVERIRKKVKIIELG